jgi:DNA-binding NarL/FixJ family response regulator
MMDIKSIIIADDHNLVRETLSYSLKKNLEYQIIGEAENGQEAISLVKELKPDLILMDINMPLINGIEAVLSIRKFDKKIKILILTMMDDDEWIEKALNADINGYLLKTTSLNKLKEAISKIFKNSYYYDTSINWAKLNRKEICRSQFDKLSSREKEIYRLVIEGKTSEQIGRILFISTFTVQKHRKNILKKLNAHSTIELVKNELSNTHN